MKQLLTIPLIFIMLVKPLWPVAEYIVNYDYIVTNLCENRNQPQLQCNGKCYLAKLLAEENGEQEENPFERQQLTNELVQLVYNSERDNFALHPIYHENHTAIWSYIDRMNTSPFINLPTPPPKTLV